MIRIIEIKPYEKTGQFAVYTQNGFEFAASRQYLLKNGVRVHVEIEEERFAELKDQAFFQQALRHMLYQLERRDFSAKELLLRLCEKGVDEIMAHRVVEYAIENGYVNDRKYAIRLTEKAKVSYGRFRIENALFAHGIEKDLATEILDEMLDPEEEREKILRLVDKSMKGRPIDDHKIESKLYAKLLRMGYEADQVKQVIREYGRQEKEAEH